MPTQTRNEDFALSDISESPVVSRSSEAFGLRRLVDEGRPDSEGKAGGGDEKGENGKAGGKPTAPPNRGVFGFVVVLLVVVLLVTVFGYSGGGQQVTLATFEAHYVSGEVDPESIVLSDGSLVARVAQPEVDASFKTVQVTINEGNREIVVAKLQELTGGDYRAKAPSPWMNFLYIFGPFILLMLLLWFLISRGLRNAGGGAGMLGNFGKSKHRTLSKEMTGVTFKDVAGIDEAKDEVTEIIEFLKNPKRFTRLGGRIPRGVLLVGEPGCGKTLLAKAIAGEADVPFFSISGSDFVEMFVGVGASRVRDLFKQAKDSAPCIIFLDEIDAVGRRRGGGFSSGGHDEREQTLNAILVEMDGFNSGDGVIVIAATNRSDVLDPALIRPGRFDRQITVPLPDLKGRLEILKVHSKKVRLGPDVDLERIARGTPMFSGADLAAIINEAAIGATMENKDFIEHEDLEEARDKVKFGRAKRSRVREADENKLVAYHEAGHAVLQALLPDADPLHKVTIIPRGSAGGATFSLPEKDRMGYSLKWLNSTMRVLCGGRIAEAKAMNDASSGAAMDIQQVTQLARTMITEWGMSERLGFVRYAGADSREMFMSDRDFSDETAQIIDEETRRLVDEAYGDAVRMLEGQWDVVERVANALLKYETLTADEVHKLIRGEPLDRPTVGDLLAAPPPAQAKPAKPADPAADGEADLPPGVSPSPA
ncbi:MAG: ATP-dependent zinc metalloprotease FtsH [Planctomycetota bacterium]